jgi:hypothetical protein
MKKLILNSFEVDLFIVKYFCFKLMKTQNPFFVIYLSILIIFFSCSQPEIQQYIASSKSDEIYRTIIVEKTYNRNDSLELSSTYFKSFNNKNLLINNNNFSFYYYNQINKIDSIVFFFSRDGKNFLKTINKYIYDHKGRLSKIMNHNSVIKEYIYDSLNRTIVINDHYKTEIDYLNNNLVNKRIYENGELYKQSLFINNNLGLPLIENWTFSGDNKMTTTYEYIKDKIKSETIYQLDLDSNASPNLQVATKKLYKYLDNDSISEIISYYQVKKSKSFFQNRRTTYEYFTKTNQ